MTRALAILGSSLALAGGLAGVARAEDALDDGRSGPGAEWQPGRILVRFADPVDSGERERIARDAGVELIEELPLVPNLWEVETRGKVADALERINEQRQVEYAQPDYISEEEVADAPTEAGYWPNDPYFWPAKFGNPDGCPASSRLFGWPHWPLGVDLTDRAAAGTLFNPVAANQQAFLDDRVESPFLGARSTNVMSVWNLLKGQDRFQGPGPNGWTADELQRFGIAVLDTGLFLHPDLRDQVAALFSTIRSREAAELQTTTKNRVREIWRDNEARDDVAQLNFEENVQVQFVRRTLFTLDDSDTLDPDLWEPVDANGDAQPPTGCDGHGTAVASVAGAATNNGRGVAGIGYNVPIVGVRVGMPWDRPDFKYTGDESIPDAVRRWKSWTNNTLHTDQNMVHQYAIVEQLELPVLNMSYGSPMLKYLPDPTGVPRPVVLAPAVLEALARVLSTGKTLGVAAAGNEKENYGRGIRARGVELHRINVPCALKMIPRLEVWTSDLIDFEQKNPVLGRPVRVRDGRADEPFKPNVDWDEVQLLCVGATTSFGSKLWAGSGRGDAAVHVAAPGERIAVAARPSFDRRQSFDAYRVARGSSFAAPMVAGAAALLRRAAPGAPINDIREALQAGARQSHDLRGKVKFGSLDIACALRALNERKEPSWDMVVIGDLTDSRDYNAFIDSTTPVCRERPPQVVRFQRPLRTSEVFDNAGDDAQAGRHDTLQSLIDSAELQNDALSTSLAWQARLLQLADTTWDAGRAAFPVTEGLLRPIVPPERPVYDAGTMSVGCPEDGFHMTGLRVYFPDFIAPKGWVFPTDALEEPPKGKRVQLAIALAKPWYSALLGDTIRIRAIVRCEFFPGLP